MPIAREGWPIIAPILGLSAFLIVFRLWWVGAAVALLGLFCLFFFRDPERRAPEDPRLVLSPADGKVVVAGRAPDDNPLAPGAQQISIFLSVFDVHVNRSPVAGRIADVRYHKGEFLPAFDDKASLRNEQNTVTVEGGGSRVVFKQIAGLVARRIVTDGHPGERATQGERMGMIRFGSRVDVFLPLDAGAAVRVAVGARVRAGQTVLAEYP